jgi:hypothetical protein
MEIRLTLDNQLIKIFDSIHESIKETGCLHSNILKVYRGERNMTGGYKWRFNEDQNV